MDSDKAGRKINNTIRPNYGNNPYLHMKTGAKPYYSTGAFVVFLILLGLFILTILSFLINF